MFLERLETCRPRPNINGIELCIEKHVTSSVCFVNSVKLVEADWVIEILLQIYSRSHKLRKRFFFSHICEVETPLKAPINFTAQDCYI